MRNNHKNSSVLTDVTQSLQQGNAFHAEELLTPLLSADGNNPTLLYLMAAAKKGQGDQTVAVKLYRQSIDTDDQKPEVHNSFANLLKDMKNYDEAVLHYKTAIQLRANFVQAHMNLGLTEQARGNHVRALASFDEAHKIQHGNPAVYTAMGISYGALGQQDAAIQWYMQALSINANYINALHNLAIVYREKSQFDKALLCLERVIKQAPSMVEPRYIKANIHYEIGQIDEADTEYRTVIGLQPDYVDAHISLNNLYWEHDRNDLYAKSYVVGIRSAPNSAVLCEHHISALEQAGRIDEATDTIGSYLDIFPDHAGLWRRRARLLEIEGNYEKAEVAFYRAVDAEPDNNQIQLDLARYCVQRERYDEALKHLGNVEARTPFDQEMLAYKGLCWRLTGDERHEWLNDYTSFVKPMMIEAPKGYASVSDFLDELTTTLKGLHTAKRHPIDQTLRGGSQTHGLLLERPEPVIQALKASLKACIQEYIAALPTDTRHPLLMRNSGQFKFSASWSIWLRKDGFHINHVHSLGWLSSAFYVTVPGNTEQEDARHEGWLKFGESGLNLERREEIGKLIKPEAGLLALFPSYVWHGTVPYSSDQDRITAPFDVIPVANNT